MIAPMVRWEHSEDWFVTKFELQRSSRSGERKVSLRLSDQDYDFINGHMIDGNFISHLSILNKKNLIKCIFFKVVAYSQPQLICSWHGKH